MRRDDRLVHCPAAMTIPSEQDRAKGRRWHLLFAWLFVFTGLIYFAYGLIAGHFRLLALASSGMAGALGGCDRVIQSAPARRAMSWGEWLGYRTQRLLIGADRLAREFNESEITKNFRA